MKNKKNQFKLRSLFTYILFIGLILFQTACKDDFAEVQNEKEMSH